MRLRSSFTLLLFIMGAVPIFGQGGKLFQATDTTTQAKEAAEAERAKARKKFLFFQLPALLNGSNIDPSPISSASLDFGEEKLTFKIGLPRPFRSETSMDSIDGRWTASIAPFVANKNKEAKLFSKGDWATTLGADVGINYLFPAIIWVADSAGAKAYNEWTAERKAKSRTFREYMEIDTTLKKPLRVDSVTSEGVCWLALRGNLDRTEYSLFDTTALFSALGYKTPLGLVKGILSINWAFNSKLKKHRWKNSIWSLGGGYGSYTNYKTLAERTLQQGTPVFNADSSAVATVAETTDGRIGPLTVNTGSVFYAEVYKNVAFLPFGGAIRFGVRYDDFGRFGENFNSRLSGGFFLNAKKLKDEKPTDMINVALTLICDQFQKNSDSDYWNKNVSFVLGLALPLRF